MFTTYLIYFHSDEYLRLLRLFCSGHTFFTQVNKLHRELQLLPLGPVGWLHGDEEGGEDILDIARLPGHVGPVRVCGSESEVRLGWSPPTNYYQVWGRWMLEERLGQGHLINIETHIPHYCHRSATDSDREILLSKEYYMSQKLYSEYRLDIHSSLLCWRSHQLSRFLRPFL